MTLTPLTAPGALAAATRTFVLHPGDVACGERGDRFETLLGSCVAIVLTDPRRSLAAMCHIVHSRPARDATRESAAYADVALQTMYRLLARHGLTPQRCEAFVYGGGNMFPGLFPQQHVGAANARWALDALQHAGIRIVLHDVGGNAYRRLGWTIGDGLPQVTSVAVPAKAGRAARSLLPNLPNDAV